MTERFSNRMNLALVMAILAATPVGVTLMCTAARADQTQNAPAEMLQDGLDAMVDRQPELAVDLFEQLIAAFPNAPEAARANRELQALSAVRQVSGNEQRANSFFHRLSEPELRMKFTTEAGDRVFFAEDSAIIGGRARAVLEHQARWLIKRPELRITIVGRSDDGEPADRARDLSSQRADAVRERLIANGVTANRIAIEARGARDPIATCGSALCQAQNRHAETVVGLSAAAELPDQDDRVAQ